jgi:iron(III) transport system permease protein
MKELPATLMLRPTGFDTLATELWSRTEIAAFGAAAPYALALILLAAVPAWLMGRWLAREPRLPGDDHARVAEEDVLRSDQVTYVGGVR